MTPWTIVLLIGAGICLTTPATGQIQIPKTFDFQSQADAFSYDSIKELLNNMATQKTHSDDVLLNVLLATPPHKRQYIFPALHNNKGMPKKILSHPEIAPFKGKVPTDIPPRLTNFAREYMAYLPAEYYVLLDPDYWREYDKDTPTLPSDFLTGEQNKIKHTPHKGEFFTFPAVESLYHLSPNTQKNYKKTNLTSQDITRLFGTVKAVEKYLTNREDAKELEFALLGLLSRSDNMAKDIAWPFLSLVNRLKMIRPESEIENLFRSQGWKNATEFAEKSDRILKAYRVHYLDPMVAVQLNKIRAYPAGAPTTQALENLRMYAHMHDAAPGDVYFVEPYLTDIRKNLKPDFILKMGTPIYME